MIWNFLVILIGNSKRSITVIFAIMLQFCLSIKTKKKTTIISIATCDSYYNGCETHQNYILDLVIPVTLL